jgi:hypothetical protein
MVGSVTWWSRGFCGKPVIPVIVKKLSMFHGTWRFFTMFTRVCHLSLYWTRLIQSVDPSYFFRIHFNNIHVKHFAEFEAGVFCATRLIFDRTFLIWFCKGNIPLYMQACLRVLVTLLCVRYCIAFEKDVNDMVTFSTTSVCTRDIRLVICCHIVLLIGGAPEIYVLFNC